MKLLTADRAVLIILALLAMGLVILGASSAFAQSADIIVKTSKPPKHHPKPPQTPPTEVSQNQGQVQGQQQEQAQGQAQEASAVNEGVSAIAEGATVNQSVNTDIPKVTLGLGAGSSNSAYYANDCLRQQPGGPFKRAHNILGIWSMGEKQEVDEDCMALKRLELENERKRLDLERFRLEQRKLGMGNELAECTNNLVEVAGGLEKCQTAFDDVAAGK